MNFHPNAKRKENETCAVINIAYKDTDNNTHFPGYWYPIHCSYIAERASCQASWEESKCTIFKAMFGRLRKVFKPCPRSLRAFLLNAPRKDTGRLIPNSFLPPGYEPGTLQ